MTHAAATLALPAAGARYDIYADIHKALRGLMCDTLARLGSLDPGDPVACGAVLDQAQDLLDLCRGHVEHENAFLHPAMEAREPGSSAGTGEDHAGHLEAIRSLEEALEAATASGPGRDAALRALYRRMAHFVGENLLHMAEEEERNTGVLHARYSDAELEALERDLVATIPPAEMGLILSWMLPALNPAERLRKLEDIRAGAPEPVFRGVLGLAQARLPEGEWLRLERELA
ncbi:hemerythrin domain-containing protein [Mesoterricola sediminis]|uniref:Hemerythrin-like domain-containing protein n=1 Tax=Mesoterricola sediminis TaxID=2927980 RepID=A0AA48GVF5_9BACT|nr:hemerythrin domain-containing protein [Mesoterricola sediminis]BDU78534.1 hypothetical protein METESE_34920 [Mesoterricola sediminis]